VPFGAAVLLEVVVVLARCSVRGGKLVPTMECSQDTQWIGRQDWFSGDHDWDVGSRCSRKLH